MSETLVLGLKTFYDKKSRPKVQKSSAMSILCSIPLKNQFLAKVRTQVIIDASKVRTQESNSESFILELTLIKTKIK